jgi:hypothetical protein
MVTPNTVRHWNAKGLPPKIRHHLEMIHAGDALANAWRSAGFALLSPASPFPAVTCSV